MKAYEQFLGLVRHVFDGEALPQNVDWDAMSQISVHHHMEGIVYRAMLDGKDVPDTVREPLKRRYHVALGQQVQQVAYAQQIFRALSEAGIPYAPLKGMIMRPLYPMSDLRLSCDVDFLYPVAHRKAVHEILLSHGFLRKQEWNHHDVYTRGILTVEPHFRLTEDRAGEEYYRDAWSRLTRQEDGSYTFTDEDFYVFHVFHMYHHFEDGGVGIRSVLDLHVWNRNKPDVDRAYIEAELDKLGLLRFTHAFEKLSRVWFGGEETDQTTSLLAEYVLRGGSYGTDEQKAQMHASKHGAQKSAKVRYVWGRVFPSYREMKHRYPCLKYLPILLPIFWIVRLFDVAFTNRGKRMQDGLYTASQLKGETIGRTTRLRELLALPSDGGKR